MVHFRPWSHEGVPIALLGGRAEKAQSLQSASSFHLQGGTGLLFIQCPFSASVPVIMGKTKVHALISYMLILTDDRKAVTAY